jgi:hypothetical protein
MRSFLAISLVVAAGCGDNLSGPPGSVEDGADETGAVTTDPVEKVLPAVCASRTWDTVRADSADLVIRAVPSVTGAVVFMVPRAGGSLRGFEMDGRGNMVGDPAGMKIRTDAAFTDVSATRMDDRLVVGVVHDRQVSINVVKDDLTDYRELAVANGSMIGEATMMQSRNTRIAMTGGTSGMVSTVFDSAWAAMGSEVVTPSVPVSMTSAAYGTDAMVAWSTSADCHLQRVAAGIESVRDTPCRNARIAVDFAERGGWMVYERGNSLAISRIEADGHNQIANERQLVPYGSAPRIAFDGSRYWVSYLDTHGDVVVGMVDENGSLDSTVVDGMRPMPGAYDLQVAAGTAWVVGHDGRNMAAARICKVAQ